MPSDEHSSKLRRGLLIERHWSCPVQDCLPVAIRPRGHTREHKPSIGNNLPEAPWKDWSLEMLTELGRLSSLTVGKLAFAQELMALEVKSRQQDPSRRDRNFQELLRSDLQRINSDLGLRTDEEDEGEESDEEVNEDEIEGKENGLDDLRTSIEDEGNEIESVEDDGDVIIENQHTASGGKAETGEGETTHIKTEPRDDDTELPPSTRDQPVQSQPRANGNGARAIKTPTRGPGSSPKSKAAVKNKIRVLRLRADATRLKQEAAKREAEAYELEVKMLLDEAKDDE